MLMCSELKRQRLLEDSLNQASHCQCCNIAHTATWGPQFTKQITRCNLSSLKDCSMFSHYAHLLVTGHHQALTVCYPLPAMRQGGLVQPSSLIFFSGPWPLALIDSCTGIAVSRKRTAWPRSLRGRIYFP